MNYFILFLNYIYSFDFSSIGDLLSGIGTIILAIAALWSARTFKRWKKEKRSKKLSNMAAELLNSIKTIETDILDWLPRIYWDDYRKEGYFVIKQLKITKISAYFLPKNILNSFDELLKLIKCINDNLNIYNFPNSTGLQKAAAFQAIGEASDKMRIEQLFETIKNDLVKYITYNK